MSGTEEVPPVEIETVEDTPRQSAELFFDDLFAQLRVPDTLLDRRAGAEGRIHELRSVAEINSERRYLSEFQDEIEDEVLTLGAVDVMTALQRERDVIEERKKREKKKEENFNRRHDLTQLRARQAIQRESTTHRQRQTQEADLDKRRADLFTTQRANLQQAFQTSDRQLTAALEERIYDMRQLYGPFHTIEDNNVSHKVDWDAMPQRVRISVKMLRAVRDKLPHGRFAIMCSIFDHLGGHPLPLWKMRTSRMKDQRGEEVQCEQTFPVTFPATESQTNNTVEMMFNFDLHFVCPSKNAIRPSMVFLFEVLLLGDEDVVVGWGNFPICDAYFNIVNGTFKTPILRGPVDLSVDKHSVFTTRFMDDVDLWLANMYFTVLPEDRITSMGEREHELELQHTSHLLGINERERARAHQTPKTPRTAAGRSMSIIGDGEDSDDDMTAFRAAKLTPGEELEKYKYCVGDVGGHREHSEMRRKLQYLRREALTELGLSNPRTAEFYGALLMLIFNYWFRMYAHYVGEWIVCLLIGVPVYNFEFFPYTVKIQYQPEVLPKILEAVIVMAGPLFLNVLLLMFVFIAWFWQKLNRIFPEVLSRFLMSFGLAILFNPVIIVITDGATQYWTGDVFKLYNKFLLEDGAGGAAVGVILTVLIYIALSILTVFILFRYILRIHLNGRMLDVYHRILSEESEFFLPQDLEVSLQELQATCVRAERWRGQNGERRKTFVFEVEVTDPRVPGYMDKTVHIGIFTVPKRMNDSNKPRVWRHFLRLPQGHIVEVLKDQGGLLLGSEDSRHLMTRNHRVIGADIGEVGRLLEDTFAQ